MAVDKWTGLDIRTQEEIEKLIQKHDIEMIRVEFVDILGITRGKIMPATMLDELFDSGSACASAIFLMCFDNNVVAEESLSEVADDLKVVVDPSTFMVLPYLEKTAVIQGDVYYHDKPMAHSPRAFLKRIVDEYHELGLDPIAASELEFFLFNKGEDGQLKPYTNQPCNCYTSNCRTDPQGFLTKLTQTFNKLHFNVLYMNHEYYPGQFEYNWKHAKVVRCADESAQFKSITKDIAELNNMFVTFMAKPKPAEGGSGCHFHISFNDLKTGENLFYDPNGKDEMADIMRWFIGGLCKHAVGMTAFLAPTVNCYKRYQPDSYAPIYVGWGYDNRTSYIRVPHERGKATRVEVRAASAASNPYLALGAILAAGLDGIKNQIDPPEVVTTDLYHDKERQNQMVPRSLFRALELLKKDDWLCEYIGKELLNTFVVLKTNEVDQFAKYITDWEWDTYSYHV